MEFQFILLLVIIAMALIFDLINGFHDAANSIATVVSTKVLTPFQAVIWAAFFNFVAFLVFKLHIADTIAKTVDTSAITLTVILAGLIAAIIWNLFTWYLGIPSSSSHTLVGGFAGAAIAHAGGIDVVHMDKVMKIVAFIFLAPLLGMIMSYFLSILLLFLTRHGSPNKLMPWFKRGQLLSSALFSLGHGGNDAQKVMGIITAALLVYFGGIAHSDIPSWAQIDMVNGKIEKIPLWIVLSCHAAIGTGTLLGGWRIVKTMGSKITKLSSFEGVAAEGAGAIMLFGTEAFGIPVSTTHTISGAIMGVGITKRVSAVRWGVSINLIWAWILTIPVSMIIAALMYYLLSMFI